MNNNGKKKLLLIGWDAADWEHINPLLDQGLLPHMEKFINEGVIGNLATLQPILSPMLWNSAATGKYPHKHGIHGFTEPDHNNGGARPYSSYSRNCKAIWNILNQHGYRSNVINWWASHPAEKVNGCIVSNLINGVKFGAEGPQVSPGTVHPEEKAKHYAQFKVMPEELTQEQICAFIPHADRINQDEDSRLQTFTKTLAETLTTHSVATAVMEQEEWDFMAVYYTCIDHFCHGFMPFHPPKLGRVSQRDFEIFKDVVNGSYRFSDMMLDRLLHFVDDDTTVILCSDHGFQSRDQRPKGQPREPTGPAIWHRKYGVFMMKGPNIKKDERIYGASLIDITPTILAALDLPIADDMDGRPLIECFEDPPEIKSIPTWEDYDEGDDAMHDEEVAMDPKEAEDLMQQFIALGYVDDPGADKDKQFLSADLECKYNCARSMMFAGKSDDAIPLLQEVCKKAAWETRFIQSLSQAYHMSGYLTQARDVIESAFDVKTSPYFLVRLTWAEVQLELGEDLDDVFAVLERVEEQNLKLPSVMNRIGRIYAKVRRWDDAERVYKKSIEMHEDNAEAFQGLSRIYCRRGMNQETVEAALSAVGLVHRLPHSHLNLGIAMARSGDPERAVTAFQTALQFSPGFVNAHRWLATVYGSMLDDHELAEKHSRLAKKFSSKQVTHDEGRQVRKSQTFEKLEFPSEVDRERILIEERPDQVDPRKPTGREFVLVSGLPRSGTSMMMQMLEAAGMEIKTDGERIADSDNPKGYYEWEEIKKIKKQPNLLDEEGLEKKAIKAVSAVLTSMPYRHNYKVIFMTRPVEEVVASQRKMIERLGTAGSSETDQEIAQQLIRHRNSAKSWVSQNERAEILEIDYPTLVANPKELIPAIVEFLGTERLPNADKMIEVIDKGLHRQKG